MLASGERTLIMGATMLATIKRILSRSTDEGPWPRPVVRGDVEPHVLFILTLPFSGSTALAHFIAAAEGVMALRGNGEGQWLMPGLCTQDRWDPDKAIDRSSIRACWLNDFESARQSDPSLHSFVEKSPPNMVRLDQLVDLFPDHSLLANNRDPYAVCASTLARFGPAEDHREGRSACLAEAADNWITRSTVLRQQIERHDIPRISYEAFCGDPLQLKERLTLPRQAQATLRADAEVEVKDYGRDRVTDHNARQLATLTDRDLATISRTLAPHSQLVTWFGYDLR